MRRKVVAFRSTVEETQYHSKVSTMTTSNISIKALSLAIPLNRAIDQHLKKTYTKPEA